MTSQPRQPAGMRTSGEPTGGRFASKTVPDINNDVGFNTGIGDVNDWTSRKAKLWGLTTTFTRRINSNGEVTVTTSCDDPAMILLARKGDGEYWSDENWRQHREDRRMWSADIARQMLQDGHVATGDDDDGITTVMTAATSASKARNRSGKNCLTGLVAQIRGLRLIESMAPATGWNTKLGGYWLKRNNMLLWEGYQAVTRVYNRLPQPPWADGAPWGPQEVAGHATTIDGEPIFVGEQGDLLWRALTETDHRGMSPLKEGLVSTASSEMFAAAVLYDETAAYQLTHGLFDGWNHDVDNRAVAQSRVQERFSEELNPPCRWTDTQQQRLREFVHTVEALEP